MRLPLSLRVLAAAWLLAGCPYLGEQRYQDEIRDFDGDGVEGTRFGGDDCRDDDPTIQRCDADGDGVDALELGGTDCDDADPLVFPGADEVCNGIDDNCDGAVDDADPTLTDAPTWYADDDADGYGSASEAVAACVAPSNHVDDDRDCDDERADVHPGAVEFCDAVDRDCNGDPTANAVDPIDWYTDDDGDGFGFGPSVALACDGPSGTADNDLDCDDSSSLAFPGAVETWYDGVDADCDGASDFDQDGDGHDRIPEGGDCDDADPSRSPSAPEVCNMGVDDDCNGVADSDDPGVDPTTQWTYYLDADADGFGSVQAWANYCPNTAPAGWTLITGDCNDALSTVSPAGTEICDNQDNDCDGVVDDGAIGAVDYYVDGDGDGYGGSTLQSACQVGPGLSAVGGDCNDADSQTYPGAPEICGDLIRQDCSALSVNDCDSDGYEAVAAGGTDCDDNRADVSPAAVEVCDGADNDCDLLVDSDDPNVDLATAADWYTDADGDGFGGPFLLIPSACAPIPGAATNSDDCDDTNPNTHPGAVEICDGEDNTCEGDIDEMPILAPPVFHYDADGDGFGNPSIAFAQSCDPPGPEWVDDDTDCQDGFAAVNPLALEICDGLDNDCNGLVDNADPGAAVTLWYQDDDGDGYGQDGSVLQQCGQPAGYAPLSGDCNDFNAAMNPGASEICDGGIDNDCDGLGDDADPDLQAAVTWHPDGDNDGFGDPATTLIQCSQPPGWVTNDTDCDDSQASISPAAIELCDTIDNDCDSLIDDADPGVVGASYWFDDLDGDAWGDLSSSVRACSQPPNKLPTAGDCDDADASVNPGAPEVCDTVDNDCDGLIDDADSGVVLSPWYADTDGDLAGNPGSVTYACADPGVGWVATPDDCDDGDASVNPSAAEVCNFRDDDCDGQVDDDDPDVSGQPTWYADVDGDGFGNAATSVVSCEVGPGFVGNSGDCNDAEARANPSNLLEWCNGFDDDCDGLIDELDPEVIDADDVYPDVDGDGWGDINAPSIPACGVPAGTSDQWGDCDDGDGNVSPDASEVCGDGVDNDCNSQTDSDDPGAINMVPVYWDGDGDGFGDPASAGLQCGPGAGWVLDNTDCEPDSAVSFPGSIEQCNGFDDDCNGTVDDDYALDASAWFRDDDGDGYGSNIAAPLLACDPGPGWVSNSFDCEDGAAAARPGGGPEICDGLDNDCNGAIDDADPAIQGQSTWYLDFDGDGHGTADDTLIACAAPAGYVASADDCNDSASAAQPGGTEVCDGLDNDCDGTVDGPSATGAQNLALDTDGDGYGDDFIQGMHCLGFEANWVNLLGDCDDTRADVSPIELERCDGVDNNCNGFADDADPGGPIDSVPWFADFDGDGYGDPGDAVLACDPQLLRVASAGDCDDTNTQIHQDAIERCNGVDDDCDSFVDDADDSLVGGTRFYVDADQDGWGDSSVSVTLCDIQPGLSQTVGDCNDGDPRLYPGQTLTVAPVGTSFTRIQDAITAACEDGEIRVIPGTYAEQLDLLGKRLVVRGTDPANRPVLDAPDAPAITLASTEPIGTAIEDLIVTTQMPGLVDGGGVRIENGAIVTLRGVSFEGIETSGNGGGAWVSNAEAQFESCSFIANRAASGAGLLVESGLATVLDTDFELNIATLGDGGGIRAANAPLSVVGGRFWSNQATADGGGIAAAGGGTSLDLYQPIFEDNTGVQGTIAMADIASASLDGVGIYGGAGIYATGATNPYSLTIDSTEVVGSNQYGITLFGTGLSATLANVAIAGSAGSGLVLSDANLDLVNSTFAGNTSSGALLAGGTGLISNSVFFGNAVNGIVDGGFAGLVDYNLFALLSDQTAWGGNNLQGDPLFLTFHPNLDPKLWDLHHSPAGDAWNAGDPVILDDDGSASDLGQYGGPLAEKAYYDDLDADGLLDGWEQWWWGDLTEDASGDPDGDGQTNGLELGFGTNPTLGDTDGDGSNDLVDGDPLDPLTP